MSRRPLTLALVSGVLLGLGVAVLLQQFAVRRLDMVTLVGLPVAAAIVGAASVLVAERGRGRS